MMKNRAHKRNIREMQTKLQIFKAKVAYYEAIYNHPVAVPLPPTPPIPTYGTGNPLPVPHTYTICDSEAVSSG
jgi:hypothetical protein